MTKEDILKDVEGVSMITRAYRYKIIDPNKSRRMSWLFQNRFVCIDYDEYYGYVITRIQLPDEKLNEYGLAKEKGK